MTLLKCLRYLARQGLALRGHSEDDGNYSQLLKLCAGFDSNLELWLNRCHDYSSPDIQNEMLAIFAKTVIRDICSDINASEPNQPALFAVIVDGTRDITGVEQESLCVRYVSCDLHLIEVFIRFNETSSTTGDSLSRIVLEVIQTLGLQLDKLRGQTYDGAANMAGQYNGVQAKIREKQPLALFVHCMAHCTNLVTEKCVSESSLIRDALGAVNELGVLSSQSGKFKY